MCASFARPLETRQAAVGVLERSGEGEHAVFFSSGSRKGRTLESALKTVVPLSSQPVSGFCFLLFQF